MGGGDLGQTPRVSVSVFCLLHDAAIALDIKGSWAHGLSKTANVEG
jgi:hypothetical protein